MATCKVCGSKLAQSNTTGKCYRACKPPPHMVQKVEQPTPPGVLRRMLLESISEQFGTSEAVLLRPGKERHSTRARYVAYYLLMHDLKLSDINAGKVMNRASSNIKHSIEIVLRDMSDYERDINEVRSRLETKLAERKQTKVA